MLALGFKPEPFVAAFPDGRCGDVVLTYAVEPEPLDTGGAIRFAALAAGIDSTFVVVEPRLQPTARFVVSSNAIRAGESVHFTDESVNAVSWFWNFGDGAPPSGLQNPIHAYTGSGTYSAFLTVENLAGDPANFGPVVISVDPAAPAISISLPASAPVGLVTLTGVQSVGSGPIVTWQWQVARGGDVKFYAGKVVKEVLFSEILRNNPSLLSQLIKERAEAYRQLGWEVSL